MNTPKRVGLKGVVATVTLFTLLQIVTTSGHGVQLMFQGNEVANHGFVLLEQIRDNPDDANPDTVIVQTDNTDCCRIPDGLSAGNWFFPNGTAVPTNSVGYDFFFDRRPQSVHLSRRRGGVLGIYRCSGVPDASGINCDHYVGIYSANTGRPLITSITFNLISELNAQTPRFTLTCISEGGPVEEVDWLRATTGGTVLQDGSTYNISGPTVVDTVSAIYHHTLTVTGRLPDTYTCRVLSNRPVSAGGDHLDTMDIDVVGDGISNPTIETTLQAPPGPVRSLSALPQVTSIQVSWQVPSQPNGIIIAYEVQYLRNGEERQTENVTSGTSVELTALIPESEYTISVRAYTFAGPGPWRTARSSTLKIDPVENLEAVTVNATALSVSWNPTVLPGWTVTHYTVYYSAMSAQGNKIADEYTKMTPGNTTSAVVITADVFPDLVHQFQVTASLEIEEEVFEGRKSSPLRITFDKTLFQLQIGPLADCSTWMVEKASRIEVALKSHLIKALSFHCNCSFSADFLREGAFTCWTTPIMVTYRSTIVGTETHNASQLVAVLQQWVTSEPILKIEHLYVNVNADCPASISSLGDPECDGTATGPTRTPASTHPPSAGTSCGSCPDSVCLIRCIGSCTV